MTREQVAKTFEGATNRQISAILNINSTDIGKAKKDYDKIKKEIEALKAKIAEDEKAKLEQAAKAEQQKRFETVAEGKAFKHDFVRQGVLSEFEKALQGKANTGKSDADIFAALTADKDYFVSNNKDKAFAVKENTFNRPLYRVIIKNGSKEKLGLVVTKFVNRQK